MMECMKSMAKKSQDEPVEMENERMKVSHLDIIVTMIDKSHITKSSTRKSDRIIIALAAAHTSWKMFYLGETSVLRSWRSHRPMQTGSEE